MKIYKVIDGKIAEDFKNATVSFNLGGELVGNFTNKKELTEGLTDLFEELLADAPVIEYYITNEEEGSQMCADLELEYYIGNTVEDAVRKIVNIIMEDC